MGPRPHSRSPQKGASGGSTPTDRPPCTAKPTPRATSSGTQPDSSTSQHSKSGAAPQPAIPPAPQSPRYAQNKVSWSQTPQHTNTANGSATNSDKHTNGHGSVGAYNTAPTSPTTRRPPGPVLSGDGAAQLLDCTPLQQAPPDPPIARAGALPRPPELGLHSP